MYEKGITILSREDLVIEKGLKKLIKGQCTAAVHSDGVGVKKPCSVRSFPFVIDIWTLKLSSGWNI